ncbi:MAG TPA: peptide ABC transporter substrate-binding protein [Anaerolineae bacterium]|nr:peptide ABC transporter substrate-binding protein [Anaerolineae bacterium]
MPPSSCQRRIAVACAFLALLAAACGRPGPFVVVASVTPAPPTPTPAPTLTPSPTPILFKDTLVVGVQGEPRTLHPFLDDSLAAIHIRDALYEPYLTSLDFAYQSNPNGRLLADIPTLDASRGGAVLDDGGTPEDPGDDQLTMIFKMLPGPTWCDGQPVTARDSAYAFNLANDPDSGVASRAALDAVESYIALDDVTIEVRLKPGMLDPSYASYFWTPLPGHLWGRYSALELQTAPEAALRPCGYGPYTVAGAEAQGAGWDAGDSLTLVANQHYFRGAPATPRLVFKFAASADALLAQVLSASVDVAIAGPAQSHQLPEWSAYQDRDLLRLVAVRAPIWEQLVFNLHAPTTFDSTVRGVAHPILSDLRVRQAIAHAIDRQALVDGIYAGRSTVMHQALVYDNHALYAPEDQIAVYAYDPDRAAQLLDEAGWIDTNADGVRECRGCASGAAEGDRLALTYRTTSSALRDRAAGRIEADLEAAGFDVAVELLPADEFFGDATGLIVGDFEIGQLAGVTGADPGGELQYACDYIPSPENGWYGENFGGWCSQAASEALYEAASTPLVDARRAAYAAFLREYARDLPGLPLFPRLDVFVAGPRVENLRPNDSMPSLTWNAHELRVRSP